MTVWEQAMAEARRRQTYCKRCGLNEGRDPAAHVCPEPFPYEHARMLADYHIATLAPMNPRVFARVNLALVEHERFWLAFSHDLRRRTQARLHYCSHRRWDMQRDTCLDCGYSGLEIWEGGT